ncbi:hypothetical protein ACVILK_005073 [Bradyrhizobium embrapense]
MGVSRKRRRAQRLQIPTRFALASKATSPFQGEVWSSVTRALPQPFLNA